MAPPFTTTPRLLQKLFPQITWSGNRACGGVFLTFDDGPHPQFTPRVLDVLGNLQVIATFFLVGARTREFPDVVERIVREGHAVGNHSYDHRPMALRRRDWIREQLRSTQQCIRQIVGVPPVWFRPPYGLFDANLLRVAEETGVKVVIWSVVPYDTTALNCRSVVERVLRKAHAGDIIDLHDGHARSACVLDALPSIVTGLRDRGLGFRPLGGPQMT